MRESEGGRPLEVRDWSLSTGSAGGGATKREGGGSCEALFLRKGGGRKKF